MKQKYTQKIGYLYKKKPYIKDATKSYKDADTHESEGTPFYCSEFQKTRRVEVPMSNAYRTVTETILKTTAQLDFEEHDRIAFVENPQNNVNDQDFSNIVSARQIPILEKGAKYRRQDYYEWEITIS